MPETIGKFQILQAIGEGGMGRLFLGRDPDLGSLVAIKLLREGYDTPELRERFTREARAARGLRHGNIVTIFEAGTHMGQPFIVMEFIQGETLGQLIHNRAALPLERKLQLMDELAAGLEHAHKKGVIHRDVKPANLMIDEDGVLRILDFGIARHGRAEAITQQGAVVGTYNYMAPEQLAGEIVDGRADLFAAGAVFYELLAYRRAFPGEPPAILRRIFLDNPEPLDHVCPGLDPTVIAIVNRCLAKQPSERYVDFAAFRAALAAARHHLTVQDTGAGAVGFTELLQIRSKQIEEHLGTARQALDTSNYSVALQACHRVLLLDPEHAEARDLTERARGALERRRQVRQCLQEASSELDRGAITAAAALVNRALAIDPRSEEAATLRRTVEEAMRGRAAEQRRAADEPQAGQRRNDATELLAKANAAGVGASTVRVEPTPAPAPVVQKAPLPPPPRIPQPAVVPQRPIGYVSPTTRLVALLQTRSGIAGAAFVGLLVVWVVWRGLSPSGTPSAPEPTSPPAAASQATAPPAAATPQEAPSTAPSQTAAGPPAGTPAQSGVLGAPATTAAPAPQSGTGAPGSGDSQLGALQSNARTQWQRGDTAGALTSLAAALKLQPRDTQSRAMADDFARQAGAQSSSAEQLARDAGAGDTAKFGAATARAREAERLARTGQTASAIRAYLDTVTLFAEAANEPRPPKSAPPPAAADQKPIEPAPVVPAVTKLTFRTPYHLLVSAGGRSYSIAAGGDDVLTLAAGSQTVELTAPQVFLRRSITIDGRAGATHTEVLPAVVRVRFAAIPANARLTINGWYAGTLPATIGVAVGSAALEFAWPDSNRTHRQTVSIATEGQTIFGQASQQ